MGRGGRADGMEERKLRPSTSDTYCGNSWVHHGTVVNIFILVKRQEFWKHLPERGNRLCSHWFRITSACLGGTPFNQRKESSCFCGLSTFDLSAQIASEVVKLVLVKMMISWWAQTTHLRPTEVLQLHPNHWTDIKRYKLLTPSSGSSVSSLFSCLRPQNPPAIDWSLSLPLFNLLPLPGLPSGAQARTSLLHPAITPIVLPFPALLLPQTRCSQTRFSTTSPAHAFLGYTAQDAANLCRHKRVTSKNSFSSVLFSCILTQKGGLN